MNEDHVRAAAKEFERVIKFSERLCKNDNRLARIHCIFYAMWSAFAVRESLVTPDFERYETPTNDELVGCNEIEQWRLPSLESVKSAAQKLIGCATSSTQVGISDVLKDMGVVALCPFLNEQLSRMEFVARCISGRAQLIPLVELSLFAVGLRDYGRARRYVMEARSLNPRAWELYNLCVVEGLITLSAGNIREAIRYLEESIDACEIDEYASLNCGTRMPNFALVQELLENGRKIEVLRHLSHCKNVWQSFSDQINKWITLIEDGEVPDFHASKILKGMDSSSRLLRQWARACSLEDGSYSVISIARKSPARVKEARKKMEADHLQLMSNNIKQQLEYLERDLIDPLDQSPSDSGKPDNPK